MCTSPPVVIHVHENEDEGVNDQQEGISMISIMRITNEGGISIIRTSLDRAYP